MFATSDTTPVVVTAWLIGSVGVGCGLWVAITGRVRFARGGRLHKGPYIRLLGVLCAVFAGLVTWRILSDPALR